MIDYLTFKTIDELKEFVNDSTFDAHIINVMRDVTDGKWYLIWSI